MRWVLFLDVNSLLLLGQYIVLSHSAFWLSTERVGHDEAVGILHLKVSSLAAGWADDFYYVVSQYLEDTACFIVTILALQKIGRASCRERV